MVKDSPDGKHRAKLYRVQGIDADFWIKVDGTTVYSSADFAPTHDDFREQIAWDKSGKILVFEVAGRRLFGYEAANKRELTDDELRSVEFTPFESLGYEGDADQKSTETTHSTAAH